MAILSRDLEDTLDVLRSLAVDGSCRASQTDLARRLDVSWSTVHRRLKRLEEIGYLQIEHVSGQPSVYRLTPKAMNRSRISAWLTSSCFARLIRGALRGHPEAGHADRVQGGSTSARVHPSSPAHPIGREDILATLRANVAKRRPTLLVGPLGIGKSHILRAFHAADCERCLYLEHISPLKPALVELARLLHRDGHLEVEGIEAGYMEWDDVHKKIRSRRINELVTLVIACLKDRGYTVVIDHLERVTPTMLPHLDALMEAALVIAAADELKPAGRRLWWAFERVEVPPLTREQVRELLWHVADRSRVAQPQLFETQVLRQAGGNPLAVITMAGKARAADLSAHEIRGLYHGAGTRYIPLTPVLMILGALIVAARFIALGLNDRDLYILAGLGYAVFFFMRYFVYRLD